MMKFLCYVCILLLVSLPALASNATYPKLSAIFSAEEVKDYPETQSYRFSLWCEDDSNVLSQRESYCVLDAMVYGECWYDRDNDVEVMDVASCRFSTEDETLSVNVRAEGLVELEFSNQTLTDNDYRIAVSLERVSNIISSKVESASGSVVKKRRFSDQAESVPIRGIKSPGKPLDRSCQVYLDTV